MQVLARVNMPLAGFLEFGGSLAANSFNIVDSEGVWNDVHRLTVLEELVSPP